MAIWCPGNETQQSFKNNFDKSCWLYSKLNSLWVILICCEPQLALTRKVFQTENFYFVTLSTFWSLHYCTTCYSRTHRLNGSFCYYIGCLPTNIFVRLFTDRVNSGADVTSQNDTVQCVRGGIQKHCIVEGGHSFINHHGTLSLCPSLSSIRLANVSFTHHRTVFSSGLLNPSLPLWPFSPSHLSPWV